MSQLTKAWKINQNVDSTVIFCELKCPWDIAHIGHSEVEYSPPQSSVSQGWLKDKCKGLNCVQDKMSHSRLPGKSLTELLCSSVRIGMNVLLGFQAVIKYWKQKQSQSINFALSEQ